MALTKGTGPFALRSSVEIYEGEDGHTLLFEPSLRRVRVRFAGRPIVDGEIA